MLNPLNKVINMELNGENITNISAILTTNLNAKTGTQLLWIIKTKPINDIVSIGLTDSPNVQGPIQYEVYGDFDSFDNATGKYVGHIVPIKGEYVDTIIIRANLNTNDGLPPQNLKLTVKGCFREELLRTKAQIETKRFTSAGN